MRRNPSCPAPCGVEALLHSLAGIHMESLPSSIPKISLNGRWSGAALSTVARLGNHYRDRYENLLANGVAGDLLSRITDHGLRTVETIVARRPRGAVGFPVLLSRV